MKVANSGVQPLNSVKAMFMDMPMPEKRTRVGKRSAMMPEKTPLPNEAATPARANITIRLTFPAQAAAKNGYESSVSSTPPTASR